jgi:hypothetical protein
MKIVPSFVRPLSPEVPRPIEGQGHHGAPVRGHDAEHAQHRIANLLRKVDHMLAHRMGGGELAPGQIEALEAARETFRSEAERLYQAFVDGGAHDVRTLKQGVQDAFKAFRDAVDAALNASGSPEVEDAEPTDIAGGAGVDVVA